MYQANFFHPSSLYLDFFVDSLAERDQPPQILQFIPFFCSSLTLSFDKTFGEQTPPENIHPIVQVLIAKIFYDDYL